MAKWIACREAEAAGIPRDYAIFDSDDQLRVVKQALSDLNLDDKKYRPRAVHSAISRAKNELILPDDFPITTYRDEVVARIFTQYQQLLLSSNALDFDDLLLWVAVLLEDHPETRKKYARRFEHVLVDEFQEDNGPPFFVLSLKAGGTGLNLTAASHVVHFDRWWNPAVENQATDRAFRIGQKRNVLVHKFICRGTIEEKIDAMIEEKTELARDLIEGGAEKMLTEMSDTELLDLVALDVEKAVV